MFSGKWNNRIMGGAWFAFWVYVIYGLKESDPFGWIAIGIGLGFIYGRFYEQEKAEKERRKQLQEEIARQEASISPEEHATRRAAEERKTVRHQVIDEMKKNGLTPAEVAMLVIPDRSQECIDLHERIEREVDKRMSKEAPTQT